MDADVVFETTTHVLKESFETINLILKLTAIADTKTRLLTLFVDTWSVVSRTPATGGFDSVAFDLSLLTQFAALNMSNRVMPGLMVGGTYEIFKALFLFLLLVVFPSVSEVWSRFSFSSSVAETEEFLSSERAVDEVRTTVVVMENHMWTLEQGNGLREVGKKITT